MICTNCGMISSDGGKFCGSCGGSMREETAEDASRVSTGVAAGMKAGDAFVGVSAGYDSQQPAQTQTQTHTESRQPFGIGSMLASFAICVVVFAVLCAGVALYILRDTLMNIPGAIAETDIAKLAEITELTDTIIEQIGSERVREYDITAQSIEKLLSRGSINDAAASVVSNYIEAIRNGDLAYHISSREIVQLLKRNESAIRAEFGYELSERDYELIEEYLNDEAHLEDYSVGAILDSTEVPTSLPRLATSLIPLIAIVLLCAVLIFDVFAVNRKRVRRALLCLGITISIAGLVYIVAWLFLPTIVPYVLHDIFFTRSIALSLNMSFFGFIMLGVGILAVILFFIIRTMRKIPRPKKSRRSTALIVTVATVHAVLILTLGVMAALTIQTMM